MLGFSFVGGVVVVVVAVPSSLNLCKQKRKKYSHAAAVELKMQCVKCNKYTVVVCRRMLSVCFQVHMCGV